jgi:hypothetical protein
MTNPRNLDDAPLNGPDAAGDLDTDTLRQLLGEVPPDRQDAFLEPDEIDATRSITDTEIYQGESGVIGADEPLDSIGSLELLEDLDLRSDETTDPNLAAEEGLTYVPPVDPPVVPADNPEGLVVAAGFSASSLDEAYDAGSRAELLPAEDDFTARVREALRADAATTAYADSLTIDTDGGTVWLRGVVEDLEDEDSVVGVAETVAGVREVVDELEVAAL